MLEVDYQGLLTLLSACAGPSLSQPELSSEEVEEETKHQGSKVSYCIKVYSASFTCSH